MAESSNILLKSIDWNNSIMSIDPNQNGEILWSSFSNQTKPILSNSWF